MIRIGFTGVPGAGKTSTARALVAQMRKIKRWSQVELVQEYARRYISKHGSIQELWEQYRITNKQLEWEDSVLNNELNVMVTDSPIFLGFLYATELPRKNPKEVMLYNDIFKMMTKINFPYPRYHYIFHLDPSEDPINDGIRAAYQFSPQWRQDANSQIITLFKMFRPKYFIRINSISLEDRVAECLKILEGERTDNEKD